MRRILVIVVVYNGIKWIKRCLDSIYNSEIKLDAFIVDNGSFDGSQDFIKENYPDAIFVKSNENLGFGKANNKGLQYALDNNYQYVYLLNQDAWIQPNTIGQLIQISDTNPEYGILSPFQMSADNFSIDKAFSMRFRTWNSYFAILNDIYNNCCKEVYPVESVMAAHWFLTRKCIETVGGFSPTFPHYGEDDNYSDRVIFKGVRIGVVPSLKVIHDRQWREDDKKKQMYKLYTSCLYVLSNPEKSSLKTFCGILWVSLLSAVKYKSIIPLKYLLEICKNINRILKNKKDSMEMDCPFLQTKKTQII